MIRRLSHKLFRELLPFVKLYYGNIVSRNVLVLDIPSSFVIVLTLWSLLLGPGAVDSKNLLDRVSSSNVGIIPNTDALDSPCLLVLITGTSQSRQHGKSESDSYYLSDLVVNSFTGPKLISSYHKLDSYRILQVTYQELV
ncbi:hypothetical protein Tco_1578423 [Tanacetum coccineum]